MDGMELPLGKSIMYTASCAMGYLSSSSMGIRFEWWKIR